MAITSVRRIINRFSESTDIVNLLSVAEATNTTSPADIDVLTLASGANTITPPAGAKACTIIFPAGNTVLVTLKGVTGDTGVVLHPTDPSSIGLNSASSTFVLTAALQLVGVRLIWS